MARAVNDVRQLRAEHDEVLQRLSSRVSTLHFAHAAVGTLVSATFVAASAKLWWDFGEYNPGRWQVALAIAGLALAYAAVRALIGAGHYRRERRELVRLRELRATLHLDDPATLLPA
jgi:hypothetical protein